MEALKKKILKYIKNTSDKMELQMGMAFLDNKTLKKLGVDNSDQLKEIFGSNNVIATDHSNGFNIHWK